MHVTVLKQGAQCSCIDWVRKKIKQATTSPKIQIQFHKNKCSQSKHQVRSIKLAICNAAMLLAGLVALELKNQNQ